MLPRLTVLPFLLTALPVFTASTPALAAPDDQLTANIPTTAPWYRPELLNENAPPPLAAQSGLLYVNFDGGKMNGCGWGNNDPKNNCSVIFQGTVLPFSGNPAMRAAVVQYLRKDFADFNIAVTDIRPATTSTTTWRWSATGTPRPRTASPASPPASTASTTTAARSASPSTTAPAPAASPRRSFRRSPTPGASSTSAPPATSSTRPPPAPPTPPTRTSASRSSSSTSPTRSSPDTGQCKQQHLQFCGSGNEQNSYRELLQIFGPSVPDLTPPTVSIVQPADGAQLEGAFDLQIQAADETSPQLLAMTITGVGPSAFELDTAHYPSPSDLKFPLKGLAAGDYTITVTVLDEDGNQSEDLVAFSVLGAPEPTTAGDDTGPGDTSSGDAGDDTTIPTTGDDPEDPTTGAPGTTGTPVDSDSESSGAPADNDGDDGCSCRHSSPGALALLLPLALGLRRRRTRS
jgi:MYXO-CTERM domain-containing protein